MGFRRNGISGLNGNLGNSCGRQNEGCGMEMHSELANGEDREAIADA